MLVTMTSGGVNGFIFVDDMLPFHNHMVEIFKNAVSCHDFKWWMYRISNESEETLIKEVQSTK